MVYALRNEQVGDVNMEVDKDTVCQDHQTDHRKAGDLNGTAIPGSIATVNPNLGSLYEIQFKMMQENLGIMERNLELNEVSLRSQEPVEQAIVPREPGEIETLSMACASRTGSPMQIQVNVPLKSPNQILRDIITHKELPVDIQNALVDQQQQFKEEGDDESTAGNFKAVAREGDISPKAAARSAKKGNKQTQSKGPQQPTRIFPKREASITR
ncbi:hypothetical protein A4A49_19817 [Nicotiana attenuata]|uniref:Uncharacterized protein n=1 Tax=Nicotiana attenuata TaxID=49451 RepID=A0A1J6KIF6_NICAT|nr:hypothetical protein A4A49_19817 [Nicotiana attenuata]